MRLLRTTLLLLVAATAALSLPAGATADVFTPVVRIDSGPPNPTDDSTPRFTFSSSDTSNFQCSVDGASFASCVSPFDTRPLAAGSHTFAVRGIGRSGAGNAADYPAFTVDLTAPETTIDSGPSGTITSRSATFGFSSSESGSTFRCRIDSAAFQSCGSPLTVDNLSNGAHVFQVVARDRAGNEDQSPAGRSFMVSSPPPATTTTTPTTTTPTPRPDPPDTTLEPPLVSGVIKDDSPTFRFSSTTAGVEFVCRIDGGTARPCDSGSFTAPALRDGEHRFSVAAVAGGDVEDPSPAETSFTVDTTGPAVRITSGPREAKKGTKAGKRRAVGQRAVRFSFTSSESGVMFRCKLDGSKYTLCSSPYGPESMKPGEHRFRVRALDNAGNYGKAAKVHFLVKKDRSKPDPDLDPDPDPDPPPPPTDPCSLTPTVIGTESADELRGTPGVDVIHGLGGEDEIRGLAGKDQVCGGSGDDRIVGDDGDDRLSGGPGADTIRGGAGADTLLGGDGDDLLEGNDDDDRLLGGRGSDDLVGGEGRDFLDGGPDEDKCDGGSGQDSGASCERATPF